MVKLLKHAPDEWLEITDSRLESPSSDEALEMLMVHLEVAHRDGHDNWMQHLCVR